MFEKVKQFLKEVKTELKKVAWPTRKDTIASTSVVVILVIIIALYLGLVDFSLSRIIRLILD
jgi:preprotein translocase subunit SecE